MSRGILQRNGAPQIGPGTTSMHDNVVADVPSYIWSGRNVVNMFTLDYPWLGACMKCMRWKARVEVIGSRVTSREQMNQAIWIQHVGNAEVIHMTVSDTDIGLPKFLRTGRDIHMYARASRTVVSNAIYTLAWIHIPSNGDVNMNIGS